MAQKVSIRDLLRKELQKRQRVNHRYSIRAFAGFLHISPVFLSEILRGKRSVSDSMLMKIGIRLKLETSHLEKLKISLVKMKEKVHQKRRLK